MKIPTFKPKTRYTLRWRGHDSQGNEVWLHPPLSVTYESEDEARMIAANIRKTLGLEVPMQLLRKNIQYEFVETLET